MEKNNGWKYVGYGVGGFVILCVAIAFLFWGPAYQTAANAVQTKADNCATVMTSAFNTIPEVAQVNTDQQDFLRDLFAKAVDGDKEANSTLITKLAVTSGTDMSATAVQVQRVVEAQRAAIVNCFVDVQNSKNVVRNMTNGPFGQFFAQITGKPASLPVDLPGRPARDIDSDGKITVLDYPVLSSALARNVTSTGEDPGRINTGRPSTAVPADK